MTHLSCLKNVCVVGALLSYLFFPIHGAEKRDQSLRIPEQIQEQLEIFAARLRQLETAYLALSTPAVEDKAVLLALLESGAAAILQEGFDSFTELTAQQQTGAALIAHLQEFFKKQYPLSDLAEPLRKNLDEALVHLQIMDSPSADAPRPLNLRLFGRLRTSIADLLAHLRGRRSTAVISPPPPAAAHKKPSGPSSGKKKTPAAAASQRPDFVEVASNIPGVRLLDFNLGQYNSSVNARSRDGEAMTITGRAACTFIAYHMARYAMHFFRNHNPMTANPEDITLSVVAPALAEGIQTYGETLTAQEIRTDMHTDAAYLHELDGRGVEQENILAYDPRDRQNPYGALTQLLTGIPLDRALVLIRPPETYCVVRVVNGGQDYYIYIDSHAQHELTNGGTFMLITQDPAAFLVALRRYRDTKVFADDNPVFYTEHVPGRRREKPISQATAADVENGSRLLTTGDGPRAPANAHAMAASMLYDFPEEEETSGAEER